MAIQSNENGEINWIIETKGREDENVPYKDSAIQMWCEKISEQVGKSWKYIKVPQVVFDGFKCNLFEELVQTINDPVQATKKLL